MVPLRCDAGTYTAMVMAGDEDHQTAATINFYVVGAGMVIRDWRSVHAFGLVRTGTGGNCVAVVHFVCSYPLGKTVVATVTASSSVRSASWWGYWVPVVSSGSLVEGWRLIRSSSFFVPE